MKRKISPEVNWTALLSVEQFLCPEHTVGLHYLPSFAVRCSPCNQVLINGIACSPLVCGVACASNKLAAVTLALTLLCGRQHVVEALEGGIAGFIS